MARVLDDEQFSRIKSGCREQIEGIDMQMAKLDRSKNLKVDVIQQVLAMIRNIGGSYEKAPPELKRLYLGLFWDRFEAQSKELTLAIKSPIVQAVEAIGALTQQELRATPVAAEYDTVESVILRTFRGRENLI